MAHWHPQARDFELADVVQMEILSLVGNRVEHWIHVAAWAIVVLAYKEHRSANIAEYVQDLHSDGRLKIILAETRYRG